jgi:predicted nucleic acid-binding protein
VRVTAQNLIEFWNVATRPADKNGFGLNPADAEPVLRLIERLFSVLPDSAEVYPEWRHLILSFNVSGVQVHDARLVAAMKVHGISHIVTFNAGDFARYLPTGIIAVSPLTLCE